MNKQFSQFPSQKKTSSQKTEEWYIQCIDAAEKSILHSGGTLRQSRINKQVNYNLFNDILNTQDMEYTMKNLGVDANTFPASLRNYNIVRQKLNVLAGEELKRNFDARVIVTNQDAISEKEEMLLEDVTGLLQEQLLRSVPEDAPEEFINEKLKQIHKFANHEWQDIREKGGQLIVTHYEKELNLKALFNRGFFDAMICGEEFYRISEVAGEPDVTKVNPKNLYVVLDPDNPIIDDADLILEEEYLTVGTVIDEFYEDLTADEVEYLEGGGSTLSDRDAPSSPRFNAFEYLSAVEGIQQELDQANFSDSFDADGNVRVVRVTWKSRRKLGKRTYIDFETGVELEDWVSEEYIKDDGEEVKWYWVNEYCEGVKIANRFHKRLRVKPVQFRSSSNPSKCKSGYVGTVYNINDSRVVSLMDILKPYQYLYNIVMYRTELGFAKNKGKMIELDLSKVPDGWTPQKWMYYAEVLGYAVVDSFKEGRKGQATGKLAGNFNTTGKGIDLETGNYIQQHINFLEYIKKEVDQVSGVNQQREGGMSGREGLGVTEQAIVQASHITEPMFKVHDNIKKRVLEAVLEVTKYCIANKQESELKFQHILDDMTINVMSVDAHLIREVDLGIVISDAAKDQELLQNLKQLAHAGIQNDKITFSEVIDIFQTDSVSDIARKIKASEEARSQQAQEANQAEKEHEMEMLQLQQQEKQLDRELKQYEIDQNNATRITVANINAYKFQDDLDQDNSGLPDPMEIADREIKRQQLESDRYIKELAQRTKEEEVRNKKDIEEKKLKQKEQEIKTKAETEKYKADKQLQIAKENQTKSELIARGQIKKDRDGKVRKK